MKRLQKKCLVASFGIHGLLLIIMVVAPAFLTKPEEKKEITPPMKLISGALVAKALAPPPAPEPPAPTPRPTPPPVKPTPKKPEPKKPTPKKPTPKPVIKKPEPKKTTPKPTPKKTTPKKKVTKPPVKKKTAPTRPKIKVEIPKNLISRPDPQKEKREREARERARAAAAAKAAADRRKLIAKLNTATSMSFSSQVKVRTAGSGSRATMDYGSYVMGVYDRAWREPRDLSSRLTATIKVTISRSGSVVSASISRGSGVSRMDSSIRSVLNSIRKFKPFPSSMNNSRETFTIDFSIREK